jgi:hypothetical protein
VPLVRRAYPDGLVLAAVMMGAAAEKAVYLLAESMAKAFKDPVKQSKLEQLMGERKLLSLFRFVEETLRGAKVIPYAVTEGVCLI